MLIDVRCSLHHIITRDVWWLAAAATGRRCSAYLATPLSSVNQGKRRWKAAQPQLADLRRRSSDLTEQHNSIVHLDRRRA